MILTCPGHPWELAATETESTLDAFNMMIIYNKFSLSILILIMAAAFPAQGWAKSLEEMIAQMIMVGFRGLDVHEKSPIARDIQELGIGGVILFDYDLGKKAYDRNIRSPEQLARLVRDLQSLSGGSTLLVAVDQEGGRVSRLKSSYGFQESVSQAHLGDLDDPALTLENALQTAQKLSRLGINVNLAPVVDLNINPDNPVIGRLDRSFSRDPQVVVRHSWEVINAHRALNVLTAVKHFPGHGSSDRDSHLGFVDVSQSWSQVELIPFRELIADPGCDMVMTAHIFNRNLDPDWPATMSEKIINGILRGRLGFEGVVISDDMQMKAIRDHYPLDIALERSIMAGVDILIFGNNMVFEEDIAARTIAAVKKLVQEGRVSIERISQSYERIMDLKSRVDPAAQSHCPFCLK